MKIVIYVTRKCNLSCDYCYEKDMEKSMDDMNHSVATGVIDFIKENISIHKPECVNVLFHGGEPTINSSTIEYIMNGLDAVEGTKFNYHMTTNGTYSRKEVDNIMGRFSSVTFSIDGNREMHNMNRKDFRSNGSYDIAVENALYAMNNLYNIRIRMTITKNNYKLLDKGIDDLVSKGFNEIVPAIDFKEKWDDYEYDEIKKKAILLASKYLGDKDKKISLIDSVCLNSEKGDCFSLKNDFTIDCNGDIYPCVLLNGIEYYRVGNVMNQKNKIHEDKLLKMKKIIFSDIEATSSLDNSSQKKIIEVINGFSKNKIIVLIAHRLSIVKNVDKIYVFDNGEIVEVGTHSDLIENRKKYYELYNNN